MLLQNLAVLQALASRDDAAAIAGRPARHATRVRVGRTVESIAGDDTFLCVSGITENIPAALVTQHCRREIRDRFSERSTVHRGNRNGRNERRHGHHHTRCHKKDDFNLSHYRRRRRRLLEDF